MWVTCAPDSKKMSRRSLRSSQKPGILTQSPGLPVKNKTTIVEKADGKPANKRARKNGPCSCEVRTSDISSGIRQTLASSSVKKEKQGVQDVDELSKKFVGAHVSISGGLHHAIDRAVEIGAKSFAMFLRSQRQWTAKPLSTNDAELFKNACKQSSFSSSVILPHGIYLMNCGSPDDETLQKSRDVLVDELLRCEMLGLTLYNFHPGSTCGKISVEECLDRIAESINLAHEKTKFVVTVLENMSCQGNTVGGKFEELKGIIDRVSVKSRVGVCLDTCHAFAAGYDLGTEKGFNSMMEDFENIIGLEYLRGVHLNDSKGELGCHLDRHENIGKGKIGRQGFERMMNDRRFDGVPMVLETPYQNDGIYEREIQLLYSMV